MWRCFNGYFQGQVATFTVLRSLNLWATIEIDVSFKPSTPSRFVASSAAVTILTPSLIFSENVSTLVAQVFIVPTGVPTLAQTFTLVLSTPNATSGIIALANNATTFTIAAHDYPYGVFAFDASSVSNTNSDAHSLQVFQLVIVRSFGTYLQQNVALGTSANERVSFSPSAVVSFVEGQTSAFVDVTVAASYVPALLFTATVSILSVDNGGQIGAQATASLILPEHDNPNGIFVFASNQTVATTIDVGATSIIISRTAGTFGNVTVFWSAASIPGATSNLQLTASGQISFSVRVLLCSSHQVVVSRFEFSKCS